MPARPGCWRKWACRVNFTTKPFTPTRCAASPRRSQESLSSPRRITHVGFGQARVESVASNRRVVHPDGSVTFGRGSSSGREAFYREQPEGLIDPLAEDDFVLGR